MVIADNCHCKMEDLEEVEDPHYQEQRGRRNGKQITSKGEGSKTLGFSTLTLICPLEDNPQHHRRKGEGRTRRVPLRNEVAALDEAPSLSQCTELMLLSLI